jgi:hypothetical protein
MQEAYDVTLPAVVSVKEGLNLPRYPSLPGRLRAKRAKITSCQPCGMCSGAIDRSGLGRVVYALSNDQLAELKPSGSFPHVGQEGPALFGEASAAIAGYYH